METVIRNVGEMDSQDRQALEHLLGQQLRENQHLVIQVVNLKVQSEAPVPADQGHQNGAALPAWCAVYEGLSDAEVAEMELTIFTRADLSRPSE